MEPIPKTPTKWFVVEHMEDGLFNWTTCEYIQAARYLSKRGNNLLISNSVTLLGGDVGDSTRNLKTLVDALADQKLQSRVFFMDPPLRHAIDQSAGRLVLPELRCVHVDSRSLRPTSAKLSFPLGRVSLLDMRAPKQLDCADRDVLDVLIFGGILGDHPPRDRTSPLRQCFGDNMRHLGRMQMSTDTAILASQIVLADGVGLSDIPFVDAPEVVSPSDQGHSIDLEGFRYVSRQFDLGLGKVGPEKSDRVYMHPKIRNELLFEEFDFGGMELA